MNVCSHRRFVALVPACFALAGIFACTATVTPPPPPTGCQQDGAVQGCTGGAFGYSCDNGESPDQTDPNLDCSVGIVDSSGLTDYCCIDFSSSTCAPDPTVGGCVGSSFGFSCTGSDTPDETDGSLTCSEGVPGNAGSTLFCCTQ